MATSVDLPRLKEIIDLSFPRFFRYFALHSVSDFSEPVLVAEVEGSVAGFAKLIEFSVAKEQYGCVLWIAVHPDFRQKGIASKLTGEGVAYLTTHGSHAVFASTQRRNRAAQATLKRAGFCSIGFLGLWRLFGWRIFGFYGAIWFAPGEVVLMHGL